MICFAAIEMGVLNLITTTALLAASAAGQNLTTLYEFRPDAYGPVGGLALQEDTFYGMTHGGGTNDAGTIFALPTNGSNFTVLKSFPGTSGYPGYTNSDGASLESRLVVSGERLYGTARIGGYEGYGTVFAMNVDGTDFTVLKHFSAPYDDGSVATNTDGAYPYSGLAVSNGVIYGTASAGGEAGNGTIFKLNTDGSAFTVLKHFSMKSPYPYYTNNDGYWPYAGLTLSGNSLYGTASSGGALGGGTVFRIDTDGSNFTVLKHFGGIGNGWPQTNYAGVSPRADLVLSSEVLFGRTSGGGAFGLGTLFRINVDGTGFAVLDDAQTSFPDLGGIVVRQGRLYGTVPGDGSGPGKLFRMRADGSDYVVLGYFSALLQPYGALTLTGSTLFGIAGGTVYSFDLRIPLNVEFVQDHVVLRWSDTSFELQAAPEAFGPYTTIPNATSPYTNSTAGGRQFFRLFSH